MKNIFLKYVKFFQPVSGCLSTSFTQKQVQDHKSITEWVKGQKN